MVPKMGRPKVGALSTYPEYLQAEIKKLREKNEGWGPISILLELEEEYGYSQTNLPSRDSVHRFLEQEGLIKSKEPRGGGPLAKCPDPKEVHELWEMDAKGAVNVPDIGYQALIDIKDSRSKKYCMAFPVAVKNSSSQPRTDHYKWALRLAFCESGLPSAIQVDRDSVFIENSSKSPFPSQVHLWLLALGVDLCFIELAPPRKQAMVERSHQTLERQVIRGQRYECWKHFFQNCNKRRKRLNERFPSRGLGMKAPLQVFPEAKHSSRYYAVTQEEELLDIEKIYQFLAASVWYRSVSASKTVSLGSQKYSLKNAKPRSQVQINFCSESKTLIFRKTNELEMIGQLPIKGLSKERLMGVDSAKKLITIKKKLYYRRDFSLM